MTDVEISSTARSRWRLRLPRVLLVAGSVVTVAGPVLWPSARPVGADPLGSARAQAAAVNAQLQADGAKLDALAQRYEQAQQQLASVRAQATQVQSAIAQDQAQVAADEATLRGEALHSYENGAGNGDLNSVFGPVGGTQGAASAVYTNLATGDVTTTADALGVAEANLAKQEAQLQAGQAQAQALVDAIGAQRQTALTTAAAEQSTLHSLSAQISQYLAQQQASHVGPVGPGPAPTGSAAVAVRAAESQIGVPYQWGAESPGRGFDCSGLTQWSWAQAGVSIPRTSEEQWAALPHVPMSAIVPGDLVFWGSGGDATHVGIYVGHGDVVHAPSTGQDVQMVPIWSSGLMGAGRP
ncbi:MAG: C40 family peptidase [Acidobacteriota bacterium]|nr:C40 family peptidase [Acidobacteriota bacterium]